MLEVAFSTITASNKWSDSNCSTWSCFLTKPITLPVNPTWFLASSPQSNPLLPFAPIINTVSPGCANFLTCAGAPATSNAAKTNFSSKSAGMTA